MPKGDLGARRQRPMGLVHLVFLTQRHTHFCKEVACVCTNPEKKRGQHDLHNIINRRLSFQAFQLQERINNSRASKFPQISI